MRHPEHRRTRVGMCLIVHKDLSPGMVLGIRSSLLRCPVQALQESPMAARTILRTSPPQALLPSASCSTRLSFQSPSLSGGPMKKDAFLVRFPKRLPSKDKIRAAGCVSRFELRPGRSSTGCIHAHAGPFALRRSIETSLIKPLRNIYPFLIAAGFFYLCGILRPCGAANGVALFKTRRISHRISTGA
jgi:hypothetical protein